MWMPWYLASASFSLEQLFDLLDAGLRVDHAPDLARFQRRDVDEHVDDVQVLRAESTSGRPTSTAVERLRREIDRDDDGAFGKVGHG